MTIDEFRNNIKTWDKLLDFCHKEDIYECEQVFSLDDIYRKIDDQGLGEICCLVKNIITDYNYRYFLYDESTNEITRGLNDLEDFEYYLRVVATRAKALGVFGEEGREASHTIAAFTITPNGISETLCNDSEVESEIEEVKEEELFNILNK